ncbi:hypothetical protein D9V37_06535 [Nocardioides mangrovicus]|uniref:DUF1801 domain-containing protein n=1 Tax=Nocardioides mangrovicus TaxID=2478913 RepID=A0A3L8P2E5_9ACTN|nr:hypothetical protein [Nocardioides mangrovicus]RLV49576.1 hypothetical protein D9V37_06535 [Nocardioides mangrovicus]
MPSSKSGFTAEEREAMKARTEELQSSGRGGKKKAEEAEACLEAIEKMEGLDRAIGERIHAIVTDVAQGLRPKTWYGMPAYANAADKVVCFYKHSAKFGARYSTFGFNDTASLDDGDLWPTEYAVTSTSEAVLAELEKLVKRAVAG